MAEHSHGMTWKKYWTVFAALMFLLFLTVYVAYVHLDPTLAIIIAMTIAVIKAVLVILYFMHVKYNSKLTWLFVMSGFVWLLIMIGITLTDYKTRDWDRGGYNAVNDTYSSPYGLPTSMSPYNTGEAGHGHGDEAHGEEAPAEGQGEAGH